MDLKHRITKRLPVLKSRHFVQQLLLSTIDSNFSSAESSLGEHFSLAELKILFSGETVSSFVFGLLWKDAVHTAPHEFILIGCCLFSHCRLHFCALQFLKVVLSLEKEMFFVSCGSTSISMRKAFYLNGRMPFVIIVFLHCNKEDMFRDLYLASFTTRNFLNSKTCNQIVNSKK